MQQEKDTNNLSNSLKEGDVVYTPKGDSPSEINDNNIGTIIMIVNGIAWVAKDSGYIYIGKLYNLSRYEEIA